MARTLYDKLVADHVVEQLSDGTCVLYIDRHLLHEVTSPQAFEGLRLAGRKVRRVDATVAVVDHNVPTTDRSATRGGARKSAQIETLEVNVKAFGVPTSLKVSKNRGLCMLSGRSRAFPCPA